MSAAGGASPVNPLDPKVVSVAQFAVDQINALDQSPCYLSYSYIRVLKSYHQLVNGLNFGLEIEVNTSMTGTCHIHSSDGFYILRGVFVHENFEGVNHLKYPSTREEIHFSKERQQVGEICSEPDHGCMSDAVCLPASTGSTQTRCVSRFTQGSACELSHKDDVCEIEYYCRASGNAKRQCTFVPLG